MASPQKTLFKEAQAASPDDASQKGVRSIVRMTSWLIRAYPFRSLVVLFLLILSGIAEGIGIAALLPLLNIILESGSGSQTAIGQYIERVFHAVGVPEPLQFELREDSPPKDGYYPDRWSLLPAFLAIVLAILTAKVIPSLLLGCSRKRIRSNKWYVDRKSSGQVYEHSPRRNILLLCQGMQGQIRSTSNILFEGI